MAKQRTHNEYFRPVNLQAVYEDATNALGQIYRRLVGWASSRKSCPNCKAKLAPYEYVWSWGEYIHGRWFTVTHFCRECYPVEVKGKLQEHTANCGCKVQLVGKGCNLPVWLQLDECETKAG